jgi:hypothetical protein
MSILYCYATSFQTVRVTLTYDLSYVSPSTGYFHLPFANPTYSAMRVAFCGCYREAAADMLAVDVGM